MGLSDNMGLSGRIKLGSVSPGYVGFSGKSSTQVRPAKPAAIDTFTFVYVAVI